MTPPTLRASDAYLIAMLDKQCMTAGEIAEATGKSYGRVFAALRDEMKQHGTVSRCERVGGKVEWYLTEKGKARAERFGTIARPPKTCPHCGKPLESAGQS